MKYGRILALSVALAALGCKSTADGGTVITILGYTVVVSSAPPATALPGASIPISFTITVNNSDGSSAPASGKTFTVTVTAGNGTVNGTGVAAITSSAAGVVSVTWVLGSAAGVQTIRGSVSGVSDHVDVSVTATAPAPVATQLGLATAPAGAQSGIALATQPAVQLKDASGAGFAQAGVVVTASIESGGGTLGGAVTATTNAAGVATFTDLALSGTAGIRILRFSATLNGATAAVSSGSIALAAGAAGQLAVKTQPSANAASGVALTQQPAIQLQDGAGNPVSQAGVVVTASVATGSATLSGTATATTDGTGAATFSNLALNGGSGSVTLSFSATLGGQGRSITSGTITLVSPPRLVVAQQPGAARYTYPFFKQPQIQASDGAGNPLAQAGLIVTATIATGAGAPLAGVTTALTDATGLATFTDLSFTAGGPYTLQFAAPGYNPVTSTTVTLSTAVLTTLTNGGYFFPFSGAADDVIYFQTFPAAGSISFQSELTRGFGNGDLYMRRNAFPTFNAFGCRSQNLATNIETCSIAPGSFVAGETWYGVIYGASAFQTATLNSTSLSPACAPQSLTVNVVVTGLLSNVTDCNLVPVRDRYRMVLATQQVVTFNVFSDIPSVGVRLRNAQTPAPGFLFSYGPAGGTSPTVILPVDVHEVDVIDGTSPALGTPGTGGQSYTLTVVPTSSTLPLCDAIVALGGTNAVLQMTSACTAFGTFVRNITILVNTGQTVTATMSSTAFDPTLRLYDAAATLVASDDNGGGGTSSRLVYTNTNAPAGAFNLQAATVGPGGTGAFTITLTISPTYPLTSTSQLRRP